MNKGDHTSSRTDWKTIFVSLGPAGLLGIAWATLPAILGITLLFLLGDAASGLDHLGRWGYVIYILVFMTTSGLGILPTFAQAVLGGWVFGLPLGLVGALAGFTGGSLIGYGISRITSRDRVEQLIEKHPRASIVRNALIGRGFWATTGIVTLIRIPPNSPFALTNLVMASCKVKLAPYVIGVVVGMTPRTALFVGSAAAAASTDAADIQTFISEGKGGLVMIGGIVLLLAALGIIGWISDRALKRMIPETHPAENDDAG
ncbi:MAG: hypothetical protein CMJ24_02435 [Phycisphaerae bacterium]|nr:hypothetical protein [Phycisphaerae bacterium]|tara:strand:- start:2122 stop:2901 length:780 start_codon:yes stop_codon:yes gene_type:complete